jgi:lipopolysaccharide transport system permease protein
MYRSGSAQNLMTAQSPSLWQYLNPLHSIRTLWTHRELIRQFTRREIEGRYRGSALGLFWSFINPLVMLVIYTFIFGVVFKARWPETGTQSLGQFALVLFCGLVTFNIFNECVGRASTLIVSVPNYVKKVVFPLEVLPVSLLGSALFHGVIGFSVLLIANIIINHTIQWTLILLPIVILPLVFFSLGLSWFLASLGVFVRDINYVVVLALQVVFYASAIFYPFEALPSYAQTIIRFNPLTSIVTNLRRVILWGVMPNWLGLLLWSLITGFVLVFGYTWFMKTKKAFADVI